jgi:DNA polymerase-1
MRLFLLDGMALIYRAHFGFIQAPIRNSKGVNTSALYGFINTLLAILENEKPTHIGVAFDTAAPTPRHIKYPAYKAQRDAMPEELAAAIPHVKALCRAFHIPVLEVDGFEADDIIGTLVKRAEAAGFESFMVTPDKDFAQLISPQTCMWKPGRKGSDHEIIDLPTMLKNWEIERPAQVIDILGLWGDASDNIPGIPGIGEKTAKKLIAEFGSMENLIANSAMLKGKQRENVEANIEQALLSKDLASIILDVPIHVTWDDLILSPRDDEALKALFNEFEFRHLTKRLFAASAAVAGSAGILPVAAGVAPEVSAAPVQSAPAAQAQPLDGLRTIRDVAHTYHIANTPELQQQLLTELGKQSCYCFDIETTSLDRFAARLLGIAFAWKSHAAWYLPITDLKSQIADLKSLFAAPAEKIGHNLKYDLSILQHHGIEVAGPFFDTMLADALVFPERRHSMDYLSEVLLGYTPVKFAEVAAVSNGPAQTQALAASDDSLDLFAYAETPKASKVIDVAAIPLEQLAEYAAEDADVTWQLARQLRPLLTSSGQDEVLRQIEGPLLPVLVRMEMEGIAIDSASLKFIGDDLQLQIDALAASIQQHAGTPFNIASPKQLGQILFDHLGLDEKAKKTKTGQYKTDEQTLATFEGKHPIISDILAWREATKLKSTYLDALPTHLVAETGRIHTHFHQLVAATGRLASSDPNLQNIPIRSMAGRQIRKAFVPRQAQSSSLQFQILSCDYSQIELRVMAALAQDPAMIAAFQNGEDIHTTTASKVFSVAPADVTAAMRRTAKMVNFGIIYGISAFGLAQRLAIPRSDAAAIIDTYFREYPAIRTFMERTIAQARETGQVATLTGRRRAFPDLASANQNLRSNAERAAINTPIQGTAADMIKLAMIHIDGLLREKPYQTKMLLQVHDELVFDLALAEQDELVPKILHAMKTALPLPHDVPIEVEYGIGPNWLAAH